MHLSKLRLRPVNQIQQQQPAGYPAVYDAPAYLVALVAKYVLKFIRINKLKRLRRAYVHTDRILHISAPVAF